MSSKNKIGAKKPPGRPLSESSDRALSEHLSLHLGFIVTGQQLRWWRKKRYPLDDMNRLRLCLLNQERLPEGADPNRLRRDMQYATPEEAFGRRLRELLENMPVDLIDEIRATPDKAMNHLCTWVVDTLFELVTHPGCPDGLPLTEEEIAEVEEARRGEV